MNATEAVPPGHRSSLFVWLKIWIKALTFPSEENFRALLSDGRFSGLRSFLWLIMTTFFGFEIPVITLLSLGKLHGPDRIEVMVPFLIIPILFVLIMFVLGSVVIIQLIARRFQGAGTVGELLGLFSMILMPCVLPVFLLVFLPIAMYAILPIGIYILALFVVATKTTYHLTWWQAVTAVLGAVFLLVGLWLIYAALRY